MQKTSSLFIILVLILNFINYSYCGNCVVNKTVTSCNSANTLCPTIRDCIQNFLIIDDYEWNIKITNGVYDQSTDCIGVIENTLQPYYLTIQGNNQTFQCDQENFLFSQTTTGGNQIVLNNLVLSGSPPGDLNNETSGGCITVIDQSNTTPVTLFVNNCTFINCHTPNGYGGAIHADGYNVFANSSMFINNTAGAGSSDGTSGVGGAIFGNYSSVTVSSSAFYNNTGYIGGAISALKVTVVDSAFKFNQANNGGAIVAESISITKSLFQNNKANLGSVFAGVLTNNSIQPQLSIIGSIFLNNNAYLGTIFTGSPAVVNIQSSLFTNNTATNSGSGIYIGLFMDQKLPFTLNFDNETVFYNNSQSLNTSSTIDFSALNTLPTTVTGGQFIYDVSENQTPFPNFYMKLNNVNVETTSDCNGSPAGQTFKATIWTCFDVQGSCENGLATVLNSTVTSCKCFNGWTGSTCNHRFPVLK